MHLSCFRALVRIFLLTNFFFAGITAAHSARFEAIGPFGGDVRSLLIKSHQPDVLFLGTSNGTIFKSSNSGKSWNPLLPGIGRTGYVIDTLVQHPTEKDHIYAGAWDLYSDGGGLFESKDAGITWTEVPLPGRPTAVRGLSICQSNPAYMIAGTLSGAYVSSNGGVGWRQVGGTLLQKAESVAIDPSKPNILYVGTWRLGYKSIDFGRTWTLLQKGMPLDSDVFSIAIDDRNPAIVYSSACSGVYRSDNSVASWTRLRLLPDRFTIRAQLVYLDPADPHRVYSGTTEGLFVSNNDGRTWTRLTPANVTVNAIQVNPENNRFVMIGTEYQGLLISRDEGRTWQESNTGFIHRQISWIVPDSDQPGSFVAGLASGAGGLFSYDPEAMKWTPSQVQDRMRVLSFLILPDNRGKLAGTSQGVYWQPKSTMPWTKLKGSIAKRTVYSLEADPNYPVIYAGTDQGIYRASTTTLDFRLPPGYRLSPQAWCLTAPKPGNGLVYAGSSLGLLRSWDRGTIWNVVSSWGLPARGLIQTIAVSPANKDQMFAGTSVGLYASTNGGVHWRPVKDSRMVVNIPSVLFLDDSGKSILAADKDSGGLFYSKDGGISWDKISPEHSSPVIALTKDPAKPSRVYVGTQFNGVYVLDLP